MTPDDVYITVPTAATVIQRSRQTIYAMVARQELAGEHIAGRLVIRRDSLPHAARERLALREQLAGRAPTP